MAVFVKQQHARLQAHGDFFFGGALVVGVEDCFAADAGPSRVRGNDVGDDVVQKRKRRNPGDSPAVGRRGQVEEEGPGGYRRDLGAGFGFESDAV